MEKVMIHLEVFANGKKVNLLELNDLLALKGMDYMTQEDGEIMLYRIRECEDKKIEPLNVKSFEETPYFASNGEIMAIKINEIIDYINKEE